MTFTPATMGWLDCTIYRGWTAESVSNTDKDEFWLCSLCVNAIQATLFEKQLKGDRDV